MTNLAEDEYKEFMRIYHELMHYVGIKTELIGSATTLEDFFMLSFTIKFECREALYENIELLDQYITENDDSLGIYTTMILEGFRKNIKSNFIVFKCLVNNAIFINIKDNEVYAAKALGDPFDEILPYFPIMVQAILLPYNGQIVYDGFVKLNNVSFGPGIRGSFNEIYKQAKKRNKIRTEL